MGGNMSFTFSGLGKHMSLSFSPLSRKSRKFKSLLQVRPVSHRNVRFGKSLFREGKSLLRASIKVL